MTAINRRTFLRNAGLLGASAALADGMLRPAREDRSDLGAPPGELDPRDIGLRHLVDHVVDLATERVEGDDRAPTLRWQKTEAVEEAGAALRSLLRTIFVGAHRCSADPASASQSVARSRGRCPS